MKEDLYIPKGWKIVKMGEYVISLKGKKPKRVSKTKTKECSIPYVNIKAFEKNIIDEYTDGVGCALCEDGDFLMVWDGSRSGYVGKAINGALGSTLVKLNFPDMYNNYAYYFLQSKYLDINTRSKGVGIPHVDPNILWNYDLLIPPILIQQAIVSKIEELFSELDKGIEQLKTTQLQLKTYRQAVLKWALHGKEKTTVGDLFDFVGGGTPSKKEPNYWRGDIPWASVKDIKGDYLNDTEDRISEEGLKNSASNIANPNEVILITRISPGKTIITNIKTAINQDLKIAKPKFKTTSKYVYYIFKSIERECVKRSSGTTVLGINLVNLKEIEIPKLGLDVQHKIVQEIESRLSIADKMEETIIQSLMQAEALKQSILKQAFEGKLIQ